MRLAEHTTSRVGGEARHWVTAASEAEAIEAVAQADRDGAALLVLGGGSNTLMADAGFPGTVVRLAFSGIDRTGDEDGHVTVRMAAGQDWDEAVAWTVDQGLAGLEALSGIPGSAGATPVQNVGAYGADVAQTLVSVRAWDRQAGEVVRVRSARAHPSAARSAPPPPPRCGRRGRAIPSSWTASRRRCRR